MSANILVETKDRIARIEIARVDKKNALTQDMYRAMLKALGDADADPQVRAILIHGARDCFTAGNDLKDFLARSPEGGPTASFQFIQALPKVAKPLIAAVGGAAVGIGTTMLLHCDLVYASPAARFQMPFVPLGLVPEAASSLLAPRLMGHARAFALLAMGRPLDAPSAQAAGLVNTVVASAQVEDEAMRAAREIASLPAEALNLTRRLLRGSPDPAIERIEEEADLFKVRLASPEARAAFERFLGKKKS